MFRIPVFDKVYPLRTMRKLEFARPIARWPICFAILTSFSFSILACGLKSTPEGGNLEEAKILNLQLYRKQYYTRIVQICIASTEKL